MADSHPDEDMDTSSEPSKVRPGPQDPKDQEESSEIDAEDVTLDQQPGEATEAFECPGNCDEFEPCGSDNCNALDRIHINDEEEEEGQGTRSWAEEDEEVSLSDRFILPRTYIKCFRRGFDEEVVNPQSPMIPTYEADFVAWNKSIKRLRRLTLELHVSNLIIYRICKHCDCINLLRRWTALLITKKSKVLTKPQPKLEKRTDIT
jgi:hypothetical protein